MRSDEAGRNVPRHRYWTMLTAGALASALLATSMAPAAALPGGPASAPTASDRASVTAVNFKRHFFRGQPYMHDEERESTADMRASANDTDWDAYCADRFRSYDPTSGQYLGYDGVYRPCT